MKPTIYDTITAQIVTAIEAAITGTGTSRDALAPYRMPWHRTGTCLTSPINAVSAKPYRGVNVLSLWLTAEARGYASGTWATYKQWQERGAQVRKGEAAATVVFWKQLDREAEEGNASAGEDRRGAGEGADAPDRRRGCLARGYSVFNADQVDGYTAPTVPSLSEAERIVAAEALVAAVPARIDHGGNQPCYIPSQDRVQMVPFVQFTSAAAYYAVLAHELTHWSGAKTRLDRDLSGRFGSEAYAMEELVAELGAAFVAGALALGTEPRRDHAPYLASWLKVLKADSRAIFTAAGQAQRAADYLLGFRQA